MLENGASVWFAHKIITEKYVYTPKKMLNSVSHGASLSPLVWVEARK